LVEQGGHLWVDLRGRDGCDKVYPGRLGGALPRPLSAVIPAKFSDGALALSENASRDPVTPVSRRRTREWTSYAAPGSI
jgi:hypothetical protein